MTKIYHIKMTNGEEVIAGVYRHGPDLVLTDPMTIDYVDDNGRRMIRMVRYNPFAKDKMVRIRSNLISFMNPVLKEVETYYSLSVDYHRRVVDEIFRNTMVQACQVQDEDDVNVTIH